MARPIEYDKNEVLSKAMDTFWHLGYESTSMKDLVDATGLTTRSMYNIFESKNGLFEASLKWYYETQVKSVINQLKEEKGTIAIRNFIMKVAGGFDGSNGCMYTNTMTDRYNIEAQSLLIVDQYFKELEEIFIEKLAYAVEHEGYKLDPKIKAKYLVILIQGMSVYSKQFVSKEERRQVLNDVLMMVEI